MIAIQTRRDFTAWSCRHHRRRRRYRRSTHRRENQLKPKCPPLKIVGGPGADCIRFGPQFSAFRYFSVESEVCPSRDHRPCGASASARCQVKRGVIVRVASYDFMPALDHTEACYVMRHVYVMGENRNFTGWSDPRWVSAHVFCLTSLFPQTTPREFQ